MGALTGILVLLGALALPVAVLALTVRDQRSWRRRKSARPRTQPQVRAAPAPLPPPPPRYPLSADRREWIEASMARLVAEFGLKAARRPVALPTPDFFPDPLTGTRRELRALLKQVCRVMGADPWFLVIRPFSGPRMRESPYGQGLVRNLGVYRRVGEFGIVELDRTLAAAPTFLAGVIAHELAHARLIGEGRVGAEEREREGLRHERLTDLLVIFLGMGVFGATTLRAEDPVVGYLSRAEFGYALACHAQLRGETDPDWAVHLDPSMRDHLRRALDFRAHAALPPTTGGHAAPPARPPGG